MGIYIPNMEMPKNCADCQFKKLSPTGESLICLVTLFQVPWEGERPFDCPLVPVPPHGRLIDADALGSNLYVFDDFSKNFYINKKQIASAPTIIPASGGKENE